MNVAKIASVHEQIAESVPQLKRGMVWCLRCGSERRVDSAACLRSGWPTCCGETMSIEPPKKMTIGDRKYQQTHPAQRWRLRLGPRLKRAA